MGPIRRALKGYLAGMPAGLGLVVFFVQIALGIALFAIFQEYVTAELGKGDAWPGILIGGYGGARFISETPTGAISDRIERKLGILAGFTFIAVAIAMMALVKNEYAFLGCAVTMGVGTAFLWPATYAISADLYPAERRGSVIGFLNVGQLAGFGLGALVGASLVGPAPELLFVIAPACVAAAFVCALIGIPTYRTQRLFGRVRNQSRPSVRSVMTPRIAALSGLILVATVSLYMIVPAIRPLGQDQIGVSFFTLTVALAPGLLLGAALYIPAGRFSDRHGRTLPFFAGQALLVAGMLTAAAASSLWVAAAAGWVIFIGNVCCVPAYNAAIMDLAPPSHRGTLIGLTVALSGLGLGIGPLFGGFISQEASPAAVFRVAALLSTVTGVAIVFYGRHFGAVRGPIEEFASAEPEQRAPGG